MDHLHKNYSFSAFTKLWAAERGQDQERVAGLVATAIVDRNLSAEFFDQGYPDSNHHGNPNQDDDPRAEDFLIDVSDHLARVGKGIDSPDFDLRLRYVSLNRANVEDWLTSIGEDLPRFWRATEVDESDRETALSKGVSTGGDRDYRNLQKVVAVLAILLAEGKAKFNRSDKINVSQIRNAIQVLLDENLDLTKTLGQGLGRSTLDEKIQEALKTLE